jgi:hypothetical protein
MTDEPTCTFTYRCDSLADVHHAIEKLTHDLDVRSGEILWFRGCSDRRHPLLPSLMRETAGLGRDDHDQMEQDLFFEFQARAHELRRLGLSEWECLFYGRHYGLPTRVMDWTDTLGVALYFATEGWQHTEGGPRPAVWVINPVALNASKKSLGQRDIWLPARLGLFDGEYWDFGDMLLGAGPWWWETAGAIYPIQINERVRAQRGWFTIHGEDREPLEKQVPHLVGRVDIEPAAVPEILTTLDTFGFNRFSIYPDLENLAGWLRSKSRSWAAQRAKV